VLLIVGPTLPAPPAAAPFAPAPAVIEISFAAAPRRVPGVSVEAANPRTAPARAAPKATPPSPSARPFVRKAVVPAQRSQAATGVPASVTIAQAILESDWGRSGLATRGHNYFGIKAQTKGGTLGAISMETDEVFDGERVTIEDNFRKYSSMEESFIDHGRFFIENPRYAAALKVSNDPRAFAREIARAGYATDPQYAEKLIKIMEANELFQYDLGAAA
jgi:flagellum-specific peptidoglycan hydrolase FlgJ